MKVNRFIGIFGLLLAFSFFVPCQGWSQMTANMRGTQPKPGTHAPIITNAFAVDKGYNGYIWKIYVEGEDPDGDCSELPLLWNNRGLAVMLPIGSFLNHNIRSILKAISNGIPSVHPISGNGPKLP